MGLFVFGLRFWFRHIFQIRSVFPKSLPFTTEVRIHLTFLSAKNSVNLLLVKQVRVLLPTLPMFSPGFLKLLSKIALHFRTFGHRLTRTYPTSGWLRRDYRTCRVICVSLPIGRPFVEITIDVSPILQRSSSVGRRTLGSKESCRKPIRLNYFGM